MMKFAPVAILMLMASAPAWAQITVPGPMHSIDGKAASRGERSPDAVPPVGVPGSRADSSITDPARPSGVDMQPTEALFDAINRGDLAAAKDAIGRGADIHGRNVLGLTPLELSVDLGRNDISFILLSLRGNEGFGTGAPPTQTASATTRPGKRQRAVQPRIAQASPASTAPAQPRTARLFAGNGGAPVPRAGFLGFDATR